MSREIFYLAIMIMVMIMTVVFFVVGAEEKMEIEKASLKFCELWCNENKIDNCSTNSMNIEESGDIKIVCFYIKRTNKFRESYEQEIIRERFYIQKEELLEKYI